MNFAMRWCKVAGAFAIAGLLLVLGACSQGRVGESASVAGSLAAQSKNQQRWVEGRDYFAIEPRHPQTSDGRVEVVEVFSYGCPGCNAFRVTASRIARDLPPNAVMIYLPVSFSPAENFPLFQRGYYAALKMGVAGKAHDAMFDAVWKSGYLSNLDPVTGAPRKSDTWPGLHEIATLYARYGIDPKDFVAVARSSLIEAEMRRADDLTRAYGIQALPTVVIDGRYRVDPISAGGYPQMQALTHWLVARAAADQRKRALP